MNIRVQIIGALTRPQGNDDFEHTIADGSTIKDLLIDLGYQPAHLHIIQAAINGTQRKNSQPLKPDDVVELSLPIGGG